MLKEFVNLVCDHKIGAGDSRDVWGSTLLPDLVFKFEVGAQSFDNISEWDLWEEYQEVADHRRWLAPCVAISPCGAVLSMKRCKTLPIDMIPKYIPAWATDTRLVNWGWYTDKEFGGRPVLLDYAVTVFQQSKRLKKAKWRND